MVVLTSLPPPYPHLLETLNWRRGEKERGRRFAPSSPPFPSFFRLPRRLPPALAREFRKGGQTRAGGSAEKRRRERVPSAKKSPQTKPRPQTNRKPHHKPKQKHPQTKPPTIPDPHHPTHTITQQPTPPPATQPTHTPPNPRKPQNKTKKKGYPPPGSN